MWDTRVVQKLCGCSDQYHNWCLSTSRLCPQPEDNLPENCQWPNQTPGGDSPCLYCY